MKMTPEIDFTIITPSLNYGRFIGDCLESVAAQEGVSYEHLVLDAGSDDETAEVVAGYPKATFVQEEDDGMSDAINKGFRRAKGKWVMWLNADDLLLPGALATVKDFGQRHTKHDVIFGTYNFIDVEGKVTKKMRLLPYNRFISMHYGCYVPSTATFLRRATTIDEGHLLDIRMRLVMDNEFYARLDVHEKSFVYLPKLLASFRIHDQNLSELGGVVRGGLDNELRYAQKAAEAEAVRRTYGITLSSNRFIAHGFDAIFYGLAWIWKGISKLPAYFRV